MPRAKAAITPSERRVLGALWRMGAAETFPKVVDLTREVGWDNRGRTICVLETLKHKGFVARSDPTMRGPSGGWHDVGRLTPKGFARARIEADFLDTREPLRRLKVAPETAERTLWPRMVVHPTKGRDRILLPGRYNIKLGDLVTKGRWKGFPIVSLSLEERATCPRSCHFWDRCYGNAMHRAVRVDHRDKTALYAALDRDLRRLSRVYGYPSIRRRAGVQVGGGFVVRLHTLGDFFDLDYAMWWIEALKRYPALNIYGYTAHRRGTVLGDYLRVMSDRHWGRFAIRVSGVGKGDRLAVPGAFAHAYDAILCPWQEPSPRDPRDRRVPNCGECGLCWNTKRNIAFREH